MATKAKVTPITSAPSAGKAKGTAVAVKAGSNIVNIQEMLRKQAAEMSDKIATAGGDAIRLAPGKFTLPDGSTAASLQLVIVDFVSKNFFYEEDYDPKNIVPPACFAIGTNPRKLVASDNSPLKQSADCNSCPNNQFGSKGKGKACKNSRVLAVLPPDADADTPLWTLTTSPTANTGFDTMVASIARVFNMPPVGVVVTVTMDSTSAYPVVVFSDPQPNANVAEHFARQDEARAMLNAEPDVSSFVKAPAKKTAGRR